MTATRLFSGLRNPNGSPPSTKQKGFRLATVVIKSPILIFSFFVAVLTVTIVLALQGSLPPQVPLFYGAPEGEAQLVPSWELIIPGVFSIVVVFINSMLSTFTKDRFTQQVLVISSLIVTLFSAITTLKIILLVGNIP